MFKKALNWPITTFLPVVGSLCVANEIGGSVQAQCLRHAAQQDQLYNPTPAQDDRFGYAVALDDRWAVVGADSDDGLGENAGRAYVFQRNGDSWDFNSTLKGGGTGSYDSFGCSVAICGRVCVIGSYRDDPSSVTDAGSAYAFAECNGSWAQVGSRLTAPSPGADDWFGLSTALNEDWAFVGAYMDNNSNGTDAGSVYVFLRDRNGTPDDPCDDSFVFHQQLVASDGGSSDHFGVDIAVDGDWLVVGANKWESSMSPTDVGQAYLFSRDDKGTPANLTDDSWQEKQMLQSASSSHGSWAAGDSNGGRVAICGDMVAVGASGRDHSGLTNAGAVYLYQWDSYFGQWVPGAELHASSPVASSWFGIDLALGPGRLVAAAYEDDIVGNGSGAVYAWDDCNGTWQERVRLLGHDTGAGDQFGRSLGLDEDYVLIGAMHWDGTGGSNQGAAYVHVLASSNFAPFCFGDGQGTPCPCSNDSPLGLGHGCLNSLSEGGLLGGLGSDSVSTDDMQIVAWGLIPGQPALQFAGPNAVNGGNGIVFGDGLRCAGGAVVRLGVKIPGADGSAIWGPGLIAQGGWSAGQTLVFQGWYRDPAGPCVSGSNTTNAVAVRFTP